MSKYIMMPLLGSGLLLSCANNADLADSLNKFNNRGITTNGVVNALASDGNYLYFGGMYSKVAGVNASNFLALNGSSADPYNALAGGFDGQVFSAAVYNGSIYVVGSFRNFRNLSAPGIAKISLSDGQIDTNFASAILGGVPAGGIIRSIIIDSANGSIYLGGNFSTFGGISTHNIAKLSLSDGGINVGMTNTSGGVNGSINSMVLLGGFLYVGGAFVSYSAPTASNFARLSASTGTADTAIANFTGAVFDNVVNAMVSDGTSIYVGGNFQHFQSASPPSGVAKIDAITGTYDFNFTPAASVGFSGAVNALVLANNSLYVGGTFSSYHSTPLYSLAKLDPSDGSVDTGFHGFSTASNAVWALTTDGTHIFVGGNLFNYGAGATIEDIVKVDGFTGAMTSDFNSPNGFDNLVSYLSYFNGTLFVGGSFLTFRKLTANSLSRVDLATGKIDLAFQSQVNSQGSPDGPINALLISGNRLYVGGTFGYWNGLQGSLAALNTNTGGLDASFSPKLNGSTAALALWGGSVIAGGGFVNDTLSNSVPYLAKMNSSGAIDFSFYSTGQFTNGPISALKIVNGSLYVGGGFTQYQNGTSYSLPYLAKMDPSSGQLDYNFLVSASPNNWVRAIDGKDGNSSIYIGGSFNLFGGVPVGNVAKIDGSTGQLDAAFSVNVSLSGGVYALGLGSGSNILVGGPFTYYSGITIVGLVNLDRSTAALETTYQGLPLGSTTMAILNDHISNIFVATTSGVILGYPDQ